MEVFPHCFTKLKVPFQTIPVFNPYKWLRIRRRSSNLLFRTKPFGPLGVAAKVSSFSCRMPRVYQARRYMKFVELSASGIGVLSIITVEMLHYR